MIVGFDLNSVAQHEAAHGVLGALTALPTRCGVSQEGDADEWKGYTSVGLGPPVLLRVAASWAGYADDLRTGRPGAPESYEQARDRPVDATAAEIAAIGLKDTALYRDEHEVSVESLMRDGWERALQLTAEHADWIQRVTDQLCTMAPG